MAPSKRFFGEISALNLFVLATVTLCIGVVSFKSDKAFLSPWFTIGLAAVFYAAAWFLWNRVKISSRLHRRSHDPASTHRNPLAKLPPVRES